MRARRQLAVSVFVATGLLFAATIGLASLPPRPLRSALTVLHALTFRVATDWLAVVALLAVGGRYASRGTTVDRRTVGRLAAGVFLGGVAIEASPLVRLVVAPAALGLEPLVEGLVVAVQRALYPAGLFLATVVGVATARDRLAGRQGSAALGRSERRVADGGESEPVAGLGPGPGVVRGAGLPLAPSGGWTPNVALAAVGRAMAVLAAVAAASFAVAAGARVALGEPYPWLAVVDAGIGALGASAGYAALAVAFLVLVVEGVRVRSLVGVTALLWVGLVLVGIAVALLSAGLGVALVGATKTPMAAVEAARLGQWPAPDSWTVLLRVGTFLAGAVGLFAVQRSVTRRDPPSEPPTGSGSGSPTGARHGSGAAGGTAGGGGSGDDRHEL
jgi:hypothetical protein